MAEKIDDFKTVLGQMIMVKNQEKLIIALKAQIIPVPESANKDVKKDSKDFIDHCKFLSDQLPKLTPTERTIYDLYLDGKSTKDVLSKLSITENTLKFHNKNIYGKLGISSRKQLIEISHALRENEKKSLD